MPGLVVRQQHSYIVGMRIGNLKLIGQVWAAPLAGISNGPFRQLSLESGAALVFTEMVSSEGIIRYQRRTLDLMDDCRGQHPLGVQIFGSNPQSMGQAAQIVAEKYAPDVIDINFGCPVRKVVNKNGGAAVLKDLDLTEQIVRAVVAGAGSTPVTMKIRTGWDELSPVFLEAGRAAQSAGAAAVTLHARSRSTGFSGKADWSAIRDLKNALDIPVIGNGDVFSPHDAERMLAETGCDAVMVGRALMGNPAILAQIDQYLRTGHQTPLPTIDQKFAVARRHVQLMIDKYGEPRGVIMMRKHLSWYVKGLRGATQLRHNLVRVSTLDEIDAVLNEFLADHRTDNSDS